MLNNSIYSKLYQIVLFMSSVQIKSYKNQPKSSITLGIFKHLGKICHRIRVFSF